MVEVLSRALEPDEREAVRGDLAESGETGAQALGAVFGLVARRQCGLWKDWKPWLTLAGLIVPLGALLSIVSLITADQNATYIWLYANNWDWALLKDVGFWHEFAESCTFVFASCLTVVCWSWTAGFVIGSQSRRGIHAYGALFGVMLAAGVFVLAPRYFAYLMPDLPSRLVDEPNSPSVLGFYKMLFPLIAQAALVALPSFWGMRRGADLGRFRPLVRTVLWTAAAASLAALMLEAPGIVVLLKMFWLARIRQSWPAHLLQIVVYWPVATWRPERGASTYSGNFDRLEREKTLMKHFLTRIHLACTPLVWLMLAGAGIPAEQPAVRAALQPVKQRKAAPSFALQDSSGKTVTLKDYQGKVVLLDFWATWCHGCKQEIPWFSEFHKTYGAKGLAVVGVSMDDGGWKVVKPFLAEARVPYQIVLGDDATAQRYGIQTMPDTFLIDRQGRLAAAYTGLVDKDNIEANIQALLARR